MILEDLERFIPLGLMVTTDDKIETEVNSKVNRVESVLEGND